MATLTGLPANKLHESAPWESLIVALSQENLEALFLALTGETLTVAFEVEEGHRHATEDSLIDWQPVGCWQSHGGASADAAGHTVSATSYADVAVVGVRIPLLGVASHDYIPRVHAANSSGGDLTVKGTFYRLISGSQVLGAQVGTPFEIVVPTGTDGWVDGATVTVSTAGIGADPRNSNFVNLALVLAAKVATGTAVLYAAQLGHP
jgi:hypothetical protein